HRLDVASRIRPAEPLPLAAVLRERIGLAHDLGRRLEELPPHPCQEPLSLVAVEGPGAELHDRTIQTTAAQTGRLNTSAYRIPIQKRRSTGSTVTPSAAFSSGLVC